MNHLKNTPGIKGVTFKCGVGIYHLNQSYGDFRLHIVTDGKPKIKPDKVATNVDDIISYLQDAERLTIRQVEEAFHDLEVD